MDRVRVEGLGELELGLGVQVWSQGWGLGLGTRVHSYDWGEGRSENQGWVLGIRG